MPAASTTKKKRTTAAPSTGSAKTDRVLEKMDKLVGKSTQDVVSSPAVYIDRFGRPRTVDTRLVSRFGRAQGVIPPDSISRIDDAPHETPDFIDWDALIPEADRYPTKATKNEPCQMFIRHYCFRHARCKRIHPKEELWPLLKQRQSRSSRDRSKARSSTPLRPDTPEPNLAIAREEDPTTIGSFPPITDDLEDIPKVSMNGRSWDPGRGQPYKSTYREPYTDTEATASSASGDDDTSSVVSTESVSEDEPKTASTAPVVQPSETRVCNMWLLGRCERGVGCRYVHMREEVPRKDAYPRPPAWPRECHNWKHGHCYRGPVCFFVHPDVKYEEPSHSEPATPTLAPHVPPASAQPAAAITKAHELEVCHLWRQGLCRYGESCHRLHCEPSMLPLSGNGMLWPLSPPSSGGPPYGQWLRERSRPGPSFVAPDGVEHMALQPQPSAAAAAVGQSLSTAHAVKGRRPPPPYAETCIKWFRNWCTLGYDCLYVHGDLEYDSEPTKANMPPEQLPAAIPQPPSSWTQMVHDHVKVKFGAGFDVQEVSTGFETPWIFLEQLPPRVTEPELRTFLSRFGRVAEIRLSPTRRLSDPVKARFTDHTEAQEAVSHLSGARHFDTTLVARLPVHVTSDTAPQVFVRDTIVRVEWDAPAIEAFGGYLTLERANAAILVAKQQRLHGRQVVAYIHQGLPCVGPHTVKFRNLPVETTKEDMEMFAHPDDVSWHRPKYLSTDDAVDGIVRILHHNKLEVLKRDISPAPYRDGRVRLWLVCVNSPSAAAAVSILHNRNPKCTGGRTLFAQHMQTMTYSVPFDTFSTIHRDVVTFQRDTWRFGNLGSSVNILFRDNGPVPGPPSVKLSACRAKELGKLKSEFEKILRGEVLRKPGGTAWYGFFERSDGVAFIAELHRQCPGLTIRRDASRKILTLFGDSSKRLLARRRLLDKIDELNAREVRSIPLGSLVGVFLQNCLPNLQRRLGAENLRLDLHIKKVFVKGPVEDFEVVLKVVQKLEREHKLQQPVRSGGECPICLDKVTVRIRLPCGHNYCRSCLIGYITAATETHTFPLACLGDEGKCSQRIPLTVARMNLSDGEFEAVIHAAFANHVQAHADEFHHCPTPDCPQVYRSAPSGTVLQCPSCLVQICADCHGEHHNGFSCPEKDEGDSQFRDWVRSHDVKKCPGCKVPIERDEGCHHVTCTRCQTHICWECMQTFPKGEGIYAHMSAEHGGFGLGPIE